jgi:hypothetical protein
MCDHAKEFICTMMKYLLGGHNLIYSPTPRASLCSQPVEISAQRTPHHRSTQWHLRKATIVILIILLVFDDRDQ